MKKILKMVGIVLVLLTLTFVSANLLSVQSDALKISINGKGKPETIWTGKDTYVIYCMPEPASSCTLTFDFPDIKLTH